MGCRGIGRCVVLAVVRPFPHIPPLRRCLNVQVTAGANPVALRRGITATAKYLCEEIKKAAKPVESNKDLLYVCQPTTCLTANTPVSPFSRGPFM